MRKMCHIKRYVITFDFHNYRIKKHVARILSNVCRQSWKKRCGMKSHYEHFKKYQICHSFDFFAIFQ